MSAVAIEHAWAYYAECKAAWLKDHPDATSHEIEAFCQRLARELGL